jgi:methyl-accepting chemotaxis protein
MSEYRILLEIESTIATQFSLKEVITKIAVLSKKIVDWSALNFAIYEPETDEIILLFQDSKGWLDKPIKFKDIKGVSYRAIKTKQPIIINDTSKEKYYINLNENTQSEITIPIIIDNEILGVLDFEHIKDNAFSENDIYLIKQLSEQLGHSIKISKLLYPLLNSSEKLNVSINKLFSISEEMNTVTSEITSIANNITGKSATQIEIVEKSVDSSNKVKDIGILLKNNSEKIVEINKQNEKLINESVGGIYKLIEISKVIDNFIHNTGDTIEKLISSINNITNFINIIMDISHKTNLLSINASIEAAHAGEYGKGFKVLADEIALLSDQTHKMIENISVTTDEILERTNDLYNTMGEGRENIQIVRNSVKTAQNAISSITDVMNENFKNGNEIKKMINNTVNYIDSINILISDISNITTENNSNINNIIMSFENEFTTIQMLSYDIEALKLLMNKINIVLSKFDIDNLSI